MEQGKENFKDEIEEIKKEIKKEFVKNQILSGIDDDEIDLGEIFRSLFKRINLIVLISVLATVGAIAYSVSLPNFFKAQARIFVHSGKGSSLSGFLGALPSFIGIGDSSGGKGIDYLISYLKSEALAEVVIQRMNLASNPVLFGDKPDELKKDDIFNVMNGTVVPAKNKEGLIELSAETKSASLSAEIVNTYIKVLQEISKGPQKVKRVFIETQLNKVIKELSDAEEKLKDFQSKNKLVSLDEQTKACIQEFVKLETEIFENDTELKMQESLLQALGNVPELVKIKGQKVALETKGKAIREILQAKEKTLDGLPDLALEFARISREVSVKSKVFGVLTEQHESAKISEAEEGSSFEVIDWARIPDRKSKPRRATIVIVAAFSSFIFAIFLALAWDYYIKSSKVKAER